MKLFLRMLQYAKPYHHFLPEYVIYVIFYTLFGLVNFALIIPLLDFLFQENPIAPVTEMPQFSLTPAYFEGLFKYYAYDVSQGENHKYKLLVYIAIVLVGVTLLKNFFGFMAQKVLVRMRVNLVMKLRNALFNKLSRTALSFYHKRQKGQLLSTMSNDLTEIEITVVTSLQSLLRDPLTIIATFAALFYISKELTFFTLLFFPLSGYFISAISRKLRKQSNISQDLLGRLMSYSDEMISGLRVIKIFNAENFVNNQYQNINYDYARLTKSINTRRELASPLSEVLGVLVISVIILYGGNLVLNGDNALSASMFIGYLALYFSIISPAKNITNSIAGMQRGMISGKRVFELLDTEDSIIDKPDALNITQFEKAIEFHNVQFGYGDDTLVLDGIHLSIPKGHTVALVGESGAGKSTIADLIPRFYDVTGGSISIDGKDIRNVTKDSLRSLMSMVTQEAILFNDTVFNNIAFGMQNASKDSVINAAKIANAHDFIMQMEDGYETIIGDRGMRLSGGQRQRITIARAILSNTPIIILDEATSALDTESEKLVQDAITNMMAHRTCLIIAHRLSTIKHADEIIVLQRGKIIERGNHEKLMDLGGHYKQLVELQHMGKK